MRTPKAITWYLLGLAAVIIVPANATVQVVSMTPSSAPPQVIGTAITWTVTATDTNSGPLTFRFQIAPPNGAMAVIKDYNVGTLSGGIWTAQPLQWVPTGPEGTYKFEVLIKDFVSGQSSQKTYQFQVTPLVTGTSPMAVPTAHPLVALFSAPACATGSKMRVNFKPVTGSTAAMYTNYVSCNGKTTMTFEVAGMYPSTTYRLVGQTQTAGKVTNGPPVNFTTGALPSNIPFPKFTTNTGPGPNTDTADGVILHNLLQFGVTPIYPTVATDIAGKILWYYAPNPLQSIFYTRPLPNGGGLSLESGTVWNSSATELQFLRQVDLAGNIVRETNTGILQQQLQNMQPLNPDFAHPCNTIPTPPAVGSACLGAFHHDAIQTLPNGETAALLSVEKIFPPGTQGDTSGLPVDIIGDVIVVLDKNFQLLWYFDTFQHDSGAPQLEIARGPTLNETCGSGTFGCPPLGLLGPGIAPFARDWLHANSLYYWPQDRDIVWSSRNQDWIMKVDYNNGTGAGNILWRMGVSGDFTFNNINNDPYPWFSHQHDAGIEKAGAGPLTVFDNGNARIVQAGTGHSRGMALTVDELTLQVTPVMSQDLGVYALGDGSAQLLSDGNYFFLSGLVLVGLNVVSDAVQIFPTPGTTGGTQVLNVSSPETYRAWQMPSLYSPPTT